MRILVYPHDLGIGGSQLNAIEIAHEIGRLGHDVLVYGQPGPLTTRVAQLRLEFVESPAARHRPTRDIVQDLVRTIADRKIDIAHGYEWPPGLECYLACRGHARARAVTTVMSMAVPPFLPHGMPLLVGTEQIAAWERSRGRRLVSVIEPPVDIDANRPGVSTDLLDLGTRWGLRRDRPTVVCVTRLAHQLKLEGLLTAIDAIQALNADQPAQLLIVGDGDARPEVEERAASANRALGHCAVVLTGELFDPRPAYEVADVCIAMGGSALRSMAFAKPLVVQGEGGYFRELTPETLPEFLWAGWYGHGSLTGNPVEELRGLLLGLLRDPVRRLDLGLFGRSVVEDRFSLMTAAITQAEAYEAALEAAPHTARRLSDGIASTARFARHHVARRAQRIFGVHAADDFNAKPVAKNGPRGFSAAVPASRPRHSA